MLTELLRKTTDASDPLLSRRALQLALAAPPVAMCAALPVMVSTAADVAGSWSGTLAHAAADVAARCLQTLATPSSPDVAAACTPLLAQALHAMGDNQHKGAPYRACVQHVGQVLGDGPLLKALAALVEHANAGVQHRALRFIATKVCGW